MVVSLEEGQAFFANRSAYEVAKSMVYKGDEPLVNVTAKMCTRSTDREYRMRQRKAQLPDTELHRLQRFGMNRMWRNDIFPSDLVLQMCLMAAAQLGGDEAVQNFLDETVLADRTTSVRSYVQSNPHLVERKVLEDRQDHEGSSLWWV